MTPTSYTYETFADYLQFGVLRDAADSLGYGDLQKPIPAIYERITVIRQVTPGFPQNPYYIITPSPRTIPSGTVLSFTGGKSVTLNRDLNAGDYVMYAWTGSTLVANDTNELLVSAAVARIRNPIYDSVTDEVLNTMGLTDINEVDADNIEQFRLLGRVEVLKKAMQNTAGDYTYSTDGQGPSREQVYRQLVSLYQAEDTRYARLLREINLLNNLPESVVPAESESQSIAVRVIW